MYPIENIIRNACPDKGRLSILVVNEANDDYIEVLANNLDHDFYLIGSISDFPQWGKKTKPTNVELVASQHHIPNRYIDAIITFNRGMMCSKSIDISNSLHCPLIVIDLASGQSKVPAPVGSRITLEDPNELYLRNGDVSVGINEFVVRSWTSNIPSFNIEINYPGIECQRQPARSCNIGVGMLAHGGSLYLPRHGMYFQLRGWKRNRIHRRGPTKLQRVVLFDGEG